MKKFLKDNRKKYNRIDKNQKKAPSMENEDATTEENDSTKTDN